VSAPHPQPHPAPHPAPPDAPRRLVDGAPDSDPTTPFVATLRTRPEVFTLGEPGEPTITVRVQMPEVWDSVRIEVPPDEPVLAVKVRALEALFPEAQFPDEFVLKFRGFEVLDEHASVAETGAVDGSIYLLTHRRRRPVR
jgi:hypothetical protein